MTGAVAATRNGTDYVVKSGDTLSEIGARYGVDWRDLARINGIENPDLIFPDQQLSFDGARAIGAGGDGVEAMGGIGGPIAGANAAEIAEQYLGQNASSLKVNRNDDLPMEANVPSNVCCANFVSAVLIEAGQLKPADHTNSVAQLDSTLRAQGWTPVSAANARPGDVVIIRGDGVSHTEIYAGNGKMIGSNNVNPDGTQQVSRNNLGWALDHGAVILRAPPGVGGTQAASNATAPAPTGEGTRQERIDQAIAYFEGQGWSRAQAVGIVANLDAESGMDPGIRQIGGGPGYGLAQWEGPRQRDFAAWAGRDIHGSSFRQQLEFIQYELTHTERGAGNALRCATDAREAASIVTRLYERPADSAGEAVRRGARAVDIFNR